MDIFIKQCCTPPAYLKYPVSVDVTAGQKVLYLGQDLIAENQIQNFSTLGWKETTDMVKQLGLPRNEHDEQ